MTVAYNGTTYFYVTNLQGDVVAILDSTGKAVVQYTYDAWGKLLSTTGSLASTLGVHNPLRYRGYVYDPETGLYYLQSRYYDPGMGRFINADAFASTGQGLLGNNMLTYCNNNPVSYEDSTGYSLWPSTVVMNDSTGGAIHIGTTNSNFCQEMEEFTNTTSVEIEFGYTETTPTTKGIKTGGILAGSIEFFNVDLLSDSGWSVTLASFDLSVISLDIQTGLWTLSLFNLGNASIFAGVSSDGGGAGAMISVWDPAISYQIGEKTVTLSFHVGAAGAELNLSLDKFKIGYAQLFGWSLSVS